MQALRGFLARRREAVAGWWLLQPEGLRRQVRFTLAVSVALYTVHTLAYAWPQPYFIEDSAISFAYARHLVEGEGLVAFPDAERVEGYSNALWTFLVAGFYALRVEPWVSAKVMGWVFGVVAMFGALGLTRRALPEHRESDVVAVGPLLLAASTQFTLWNASGLENSLFCALLAVGGWRLAVEVEDERSAPWSAIAFFGLTMTRPDGIAYAAIALFARACGMVARRQWKASVLWLLALAVPWLAYNAWRYDYFGWEWANTYYAKEKDFKPLNWNSGGWKYARDFGWKYGAAFALPVAVLGAAGWTRWRKWVAIVAGLLMLPLFACDGDMGGWLGAHVVELRVGFLVALAAGAGLATFGREGWLARGFLWASLAAGIFFAVWANGDWMKGFRWFSLTSVPFFSLVTVGFVHLAEALAGWRPKVGKVPLGTLVACVLATALAAPNAWKTPEFLQSPETQPRDVRKRVNFMKWVQDRLDLEQVTLLDVDMGAHLWWTDWRIVDIAGLVDVPIARHAWQKEFTREYVFKETRPDFAHVHGGWARTSRIGQQPEWQQQYVEIPGYPSGKTAFHVGNHVRRDLLVGTAWEGPSGGTVRFAGGVELVGWHVPSPEVAPGDELTVHTGWRLLDGRTAGFRVLLVLSRGGEERVHAMEVAPAYDWLAPSKWREGEIGWGRWQVALPKDLSEGTWDLGFVVLDEATGAVLPVLLESEGGVASAPAPEVPRAGQPASVEVAKEGVTSARYAVGEWLAPAAVRLVSRADARARGEEDVQDALKRAQAKDCDGAAAALRRAGWHLATDQAWSTDIRARTDAARVACWIARAEDVRDPIERAALLTKARRVDHHDEALLARTGPLARDLEAQGDAAAARKDWEGAFAAYLAAVEVDPRRSRARRMAEAARDARLKLPTKGQPSLVDAP